MAGFLKGLKNLVVESDEVKSVEKAQPSMAAVAPTVNLVTEHSGSDGEVYDHLRAETQFENTDAGLIVSKYKAALEGVPLTDDMKVKTAITQAKKLDGVTDERILASFDQMRANLASQQDQFAANMVNFKAAEIDDRQARIEVLTKEIQERQDTLSKLTTDLSEAQGTVARVQSQFNMAEHRRGQEIDQDKLRFSALLKG